MRRKNDPATVKLGSMGSVLQNLKAELDGGKQAADVEAARILRPGPEHLVRKVKLTAAAAARLKADEAAQSTVKPQPVLKAKPPIRVPKPQGRPPRPPHPLDLWKSAARRVREVVRSSSPAIEDRPDQVSSQSSQQINTALAAGADIIARRSAPDLDNGYIIGFDLGTSSLKCAVRQPYHAGDPVKALTAPVELQSGGHPCLWQAVVWFDPRSQRFTLYPEKGAIAIGGFKTGMVGGHGNRWVLPEVPVTRAEAAVAFMALQFAYILGRYQQQRPLGPSAGDHFLAVNIGIPVAAQDDQRTFGEFSRVVAAAFELAAIASELQLKDVRSIHANAKPELPPGFSLVPELTAAISAYAVQPTAPVGAHILVDVGASTLDIVAFNLIKRARASVFTAGVELLGAAALDVARGVGIDDVDFKRACDHQFDSVYGGARHQRRAPSLFDPRLRRRPVQLLTTGGGCATALHTKFIDEMPQPSVLGDVQPMRPLPPANITSHSCDTSRLLLAYGLTRDEPELLELRLPSQIDDLEVSASSSPTMISKDDV